MRAVHTAIPLRGHPLHEHYLRMVAAVVMHYVKYRQAAICAGPQHARRIHEIAIALDGYRQAPVLLVGKRSSSGRGRAIALAAAGRRTGEVIMLGHIPQPPMP